MTEITPSRALDHLVLPDKEIVLSNFRKKLRPSEPQMWRNLPQEDLAVINRMLTPSLQELGYVA